MKFSTFKRLANELRPYILQAAGQKGDDTSRRLVPNYHLMSELLVQSVGSLGALHTT